MPTKPSTSLEVVPNAHWSATSTSAAASRPRSGPSTASGRSSSIQASAAVHLGLRLVLLSGLLGLGACASTSARPASREGAVGPIAWRAEDVGGVTRTIHGKEADAYTFTLVVKETRGSGITFTRFETTVSDRETFRGTPHVATGTWKLAPNGEWRIPLPYSVSCPNLPGGSCAVFQMAAPLWQIRLSGRDDQGQPVDVPITVALPPASLRLIFK
jgi:hypothetical protein